MQQERFPTTEDLLHPGLEPPATDHLQITTEAVHRPAHKVMTEAVPQGQATTVVLLQADQATAVVHLQAGQAMEAVRLRATAGAVRQVVPAGQVEEEDKLSWKNQLNLTII